MIYDLDTKEGWLYAAQLAGDFGWRHGLDGIRQLSRNKLIPALLKNTELVNIRNGHEKHLRHAYGAAYWAASVSEGSPTEVEDK